MYQVYGNKTTLSLEMFERDVQPIMDEYLTSDIREKNFVKEARVWSNYDDYRPMVEFAKSKKLNVICANAAGRYTNLVGRKGQAALMALPDASKDFMAPLPYDTASGAYYDKLTELFMMEVTVDSATGKKLLLLWADLILFKASRYGMLQWLIQLQNITKTQGQ